MADEEHVRPEVSEAAKKAAAWLEEWAREAKVDLQKLTGGEWFIVAMKVPCPIRCWRVGVSIPVGPNEECPECGKINTVTLWDRLLEDGEI